MDILEYYQLKEQPFRISPDPRFLYLSDQVKEALGKVQYMTAERIGPLYLYGPIGAGKTSIMRRLYERLQDDERNQVVLLIAPNVHSANAFLRMVMDAFSVKTERSYVASLKNFEIFLAEQYRAGRVPVLLVDEAQNLSRDVLKLVHYLLNYETETAKLLQIVLAGQEELAVKVMRYRELASRMFPIAMSAMTPDELNEMIAFRWLVAGGTDSSPFTPESLRELYGASKGLPRDAVKLADETVRTLFFRHQKVASAALMHELARTLNLGGPVRG